MKKNIILILFILLLGGCAQLPTPQNIPWQKHQQQIENLTHWSFNGKVAVITAEKRHSLNIYWQQSGNDFHITLTTFLGGAILDLKKTPYQTFVVDKDGNQFQGDDPENLIRDLSGLIIPIKPLQQWIKGNPDSASFELNALNQLESLSGKDSKNSPWSINYTDYRFTEGVSLPHKLQLKHADLRLKFAISKWTID